MSSLEQESATAIDRALELLLRPPAPDRTYKSERDFATSTDFAIEDDLRALLRRLTPHLGFLGEERGHTGSLERYWCLDPIDGTTNYSRGLPNYGVALALVDNAVAVHGEVALPAHRERYHTLHGGAFCNGAQVRASETSSLDDAIIAFGDFATGPGSVDKNAHRLSVIARLAARVGRVRMLGSAATDFAWLAAGHLDAVIIHSNHTWDVAAGVALARAAGAVVTHHDGQPYTLTGPDVLAAAPGIHRNLVSLLSSRPATSAPRESFLR